MKIATPKLRIAFGNQGISIEKWTKAVRKVEKALIDNGLADKASECTVTNRGQTLVLLSPDAVEVWSLDL